MSILRKIVEVKRREVAERQARRPLANLSAPATPPRDFAAALQTPGVSAICEIKRRSPSKGLLRENLNVAEVARSYASSGAAAISVLTDEHFFSGSDDDLQTAATAAPLPLLRKDFTIDAYQIHEARAIGASAILLIVRILSDDQIREFARIADELGLATLVEVHDEPELQRALSCEARIIGINSRDLDTFEVSLDTTLELRKRVPAGRITIAESGIHTHDDVRRVADAGFDAILVGEALMKAPNPGVKLRQFLRGDDA